MRGSAANRSPSIAALHSDSGVVPQLGVWAVTEAGDRRAMSVPAFGSVFAPRGEKLDMR